MLHGYFNYSNSVAGGYWDRHAFLRSWWRVYRGDVRWTPPHFPTLYRMLVRDKSEYLARLRPQLIHMQALQDTRRPSDKGIPRPSASMWETTVGAAVLLADPRRRDRTAYLALLRCVNNVEALERFVGLALEQAAQVGYRRLVGPTGLSPHLQTGVLQDHFHITPPLHTPYNPPYVPEVMQGALSPLPASRLYCLETDAPTEDIGPVDGSAARIVRIGDADHKPALIPLFPRVFDDVGEFPAPDEAEAEFLLDWIAPWPYTAWAALRDGEPVGFVILQPDLAGPVTRAQGGRNLLWRTWLKWRSGRPVSSGRLLFGGVVPEHRGQGIGSRLLQHALHMARTAGWQNLMVGPLPPTHPSVPLLLAHGAQARQSYRLYASEV